MVKQKIYQINDFSTPAGRRKQFIVTSFSTNSVLHQNEKEMDKNYAIQPEHTAIYKKQYKHHYTISFRVF